MDKRRKVSATNSRIINFSDNVTKAIIAEAEEILEDAEKVVKEFVPARFVNKTLAAIEAKLEREGIEALFDKTVTREALKKTAGDEATNDELQELVDEIVDAVVEELEDVLKDADEVMTEEKTTISAEEAADEMEVESKLKSIVERKLHAKGIHVAFERTATKRKTIAEKIREAANKK